MTKEQTIAIMVRLDSAVAALRAAVDVAAQVAVSADGEDLGETLHEVLGDALASAQDANRLCREFLAGEHDD